MSEEFLGGFEGAEKSEDTYEGLTKADWIEDALMYGRAQAGLGTYDPGKRFGTDDTNGAIFTAFLKLAVENGGKYDEGCDDEARRILGELFEDFVARKIRKEARRPKEVVDNEGTSGTQRAVEELGVTSLDEDDLARMLFQIMDEIDDGEGSKSSSVTMQWGGATGKVVMVDDRVGEEGSALDATVVEMDEEGNAALMRLCEREEACIVEDALFFSSEKDHELRNYHMRRLPVNGIFVPGKLSLVSSRVASLADDHLAANEVEVVDAQNFRFPPKTDIGSKMRLVAVDPMQVLHEGVTIHGGELEISNASSFFTLDFVELMMKIGVKRLNLIHCRLLGEDELPAAAELFRASDIDLGEVGGMGALIIREMLDGRKIQDEESAVQFDLAALGIDVTELEAAVVQSKADYDEVMAKSPLDEEQAMAVAGPVKRLWNWLSGIVKR